MYKGFFPSNSSFVELLVRSASYNYSFVLVWREVCSVRLAPTPSPVPSRNVGFEVWPNFVPSAGSYKEGVYENYFQCAEIVTLVSFTAKKVVGSLTNH